jgi:hypothetical protein
MRTIHVLDAGDTQRFSVRTDFLDDSLTHTNPIASFRSMLASLRCSGALRLLRLDE